jgi:hypothetical protein
MTTYDADVDCPMCSQTIDAAQLCEDDDPTCVRCCAIYHGRNGLMAVVA